MRAETDAAVARLTTVGATRVYREGEVPASPVTAYFVVSAGSGVEDTFRVGDVATSQKNRLVVRFFGKSYTEYAWAAEKADQAFRGHRLAVTGKTTTKCKREIDTSLDVEAPLIGGIHTYTFMSSPA